MLRFLKLPTLPDPELNRLTRLLFWIIVPQLLCILAYTLLTLVVDWAHFQRHLIIFGVLTVGDLLALAATVRGRARLAAMINSMVVFLIATGSMLVVDGIGVGAIGGYLYLVLSVGVSLGNFQSFLVGVVSLAAGLVSILLDSRGIIPLQHISISPLQNWAIFACFVAIFFVLQVVARKSLNEALGRSREELALRTQAEAELRQSEERFRFLADATFEGRCIVEEGRILFANRQLAEMVGYSTEELVGRDTISLVPQEMRERLLEIRKQPEVIDTLVGIRRDGSRFPAEIRRRPMVYFGRTVQSIAVRDMSESQRLKAAKQESENKYRDIVNSVRDAVFSISPSGMLSSLNPAFGEITGLDETDWIGRDFQGLLHPDDVRPALRLFNRVIGGSVGDAVELRIRTKGKSYATVEVVASPLVRDGGVVGVLGIARDVTERNALTGQVRRMQRLDTIGALAGGMAHDLNNTLAPILPAIDLVRASGVDPSIENILGIVEQSVYRGRDIVQQVLTFAHGRDDEFGVIQLRYLVQEVHSILRTTFPSNVAIDVSVPRTLAPVRGNATQLHQVLMNLCLNARDAMPDGGRLSIAASNAPGDGGAPQAVEVRVADTGVGIPEAIQGEIFKPLFTTKEAGKGTGLGLSTVVNIVREHQGSIDFENRVDGGAVFTIRLPAEPTSTSSTEATARSDRVPQGRGQHVVIVEDDRSVGEICRQTLEAYGYDPVVFSTGVAAIEHVRGRGPGNTSVVVVDFRLPFVTAAHTIRELRTIDPDLRAVAMVDQDTVPKDFLSWWHSTVGGGQLECLRKPFTSVELAREIASVADGIG